MLSRTFLALVFIWLVLLCVPAFRSQSRRMGEVTTAPSSQIMTPLAGDEEVAQLALENPNDGVLALQALRVRTAKYQPDYWREFDQLIARLPKDLALRRAKMIDATSSRLTLPFYSPGFGASGNALPTQKDRDEILKRQNKAQRELLVRQAREGAKQAPDDGFFRWVEAMALWNSDGEPALKALERAAKCRGFDDGILSYQRARIRWAQTRRPLDWDQKYDYLAQALLPHYSQMRALQREIVASGIERYRRGDKAGAYRRWKIALQAAGAFRRAQLQGDHAFYIGLLVSESLEKLVWGAVNRELLAKTGAKPKGAVSFTAFVALARRDGYREVADLATRERAAFQADKFDLTRDLDAYQRALGVSLTDTRLQMQMPWAARNIYWLSVAGVLALLLCAPLRWLERRMHRDFLGAVSWLSIAALAALWLGVLGMATWFRVGPELAEMQSHATKNDLVAPGMEFLVAIFDNPWLFWGSIFAIVLSATALCYVRRQRTGQSANLGWPFVLGALAIIPTFLLYTIVARSDFIWIALWFFWLVLVGAALAIAVFRIERNVASPALRLRARLKLASALCATIGIGTWLWFGGINDWIPLITVASSGVWSVGLLIYLMMSDATQRRFALRSLSVAMQTLGGVAAVCAVALLLASLAALPVRARQNRIMDDYIARGEIDWMRGQMQISDVQK